MRNYKDVGNIKTFIKKIKKDTEIKVIMLESLPKDERGSYKVPDNVITFDVASHVIHTYGRTIEINRKLHAYLKKEGYACVWIRCWGGNKVSWISLTPTDNYKLYESYY